MDETPTPEALDQRRRRLLFRATHRGTRETDLLVGGFVARRLAAFTDFELSALEEILELPDPMLADWLTGRAPLPSEYPMLAVMHGEAICNGGSSREGVLRTTGGGAPHPGLS